MVELEDDETKFGGISCIGETLEHFMREVNLPFGTSLKKVNDTLVENGIKPIDPARPPLSMIK